MQASARSEILASFGGQSRHIYDLCNMQHTVEVSAFTWFTTGALLDFKLPLGCRTPGANTKRRMCCFTIELPHVAGNLDAAVGDYRMAY